MMACKSLFEVIFGVLRTLDLLCLRNMLCLPNMPAEVMAIF